MNSGAAARRDPSGPRLHALYFLSGATALAYEVLWARLLTAHFGLSIIGVAITVAAFLMGLGAGSLLAGRMAVQAGAALRRYALLEAGVALYALALPGLAALGSPLLEDAAPFLAAPLWWTLQAALATLLLALPAAALGAGLPLMLRAHPAGAQALARLYGWNCLGAAVGALGCALLLATVGWDRALQVCAALGLLVAGLAGRLARGAAARTSTRPDAGSATSADASGDRSADASLGAPAGAATRGPPVAVLLAYAGVGACALVLEMGWTRLYGMVLLRTEYVLALLLALFLLGTAAGSHLLARALARPARQTLLRELPGLLPLVACTATLLGLWALPAAARWLQGQVFTSLAAALAWQALVLAPFVLPATAALGAWLPLLATRPAANAGAPAADRQPATHYAAALYAANCGGAALGAILAVLVGLPLLGTTASLALCAVALLLLGLVLAPQGRVRRTLLLALLPALAGAWLLHGFAPPQRMLRTLGPDTRELYRYEDALSLNHVIGLPDGQRVLLNDLQHMDAASDPASVRIQADQARLPLLLRPDARSILFLGLGTGISASGALPFPMVERTAVEVSPGAIASASTWFAPVNGGVMQGMHVVHDDVRHYLMAQTRQYDVIVGDLFHPDLAGMGSLLSVEQFTRVRSRLAPDGVFVQWLALNQFDRRALRTVLRSFAQVFPQAQIYLDGLHLALVGCPQGLAPSPLLQQALDRLTPAQARAATGGEDLASWLGRYWGPIAAGVGPVEQENAPVIEFALPGLRYREQEPLAEILQELLRQRPDVASAAAALGVSAAQTTDFANAYLASELSVQSWTAALAGDSGQAEQRMRLAYEANPRDHWVASAVADTLYARAAQAHELGDPQVVARILRVFPEHLESLRLQLAQAPPGGSAQGVAARAALRAVAPLDPALDVNSRPHSETP